MSVSTMQNRQKQVEYRSGGESVSSRDVREVREVFYAYARPRKCRTVTNRKRHKETAPFLTRLRYSTLTYPLLHLDLKEEACRLFVLLNLGRNSKLHITIIHLSSIDLNGI